MNLNENFSTLSGVYFVEESREHFDFLTYGLLKLKTGARQSTGYSDHSNRFRVVKAPLNGKYSVGDYVWGHHLIYSHPVSFMKGVFATLESNIWFSGQTPETPKGLDEEVTIFKPFIEYEKSSNGIVYQLKKENVLRGSVLHGKLPVGSIITYWLNKEYEIFYGEERYFIIDNRWITSLNGEPYNEFYRCEYFDSEEVVVNGITLYGKLAAMLKYNIEQTNGYLAKLYNPKLPLHGKVAILNKKWEYSTVAGNDGRGIIAVLT
jgi:hypothetical protein